MLIKYINVYIILNEIKIYTESLNNTETHRKKSESNPNLRQAVPKNFVSYNMKFLSKLFYRVVYRNII